MASSSLFVDWGTKNSPRNRGCYSQCCCFCRSCKSLVSERPQLPRRSHHLAGSLKQSLSWAKWKFLTFVHASCRLDQLCVCHIVQKLILCSCVASLREWVEDLSFVEKTRLAVVCCRCFVVVAVPFLNLSINVLFLKTTTTTWMRRFNAQAIKMLRHGLFFAQHLLGVLALPTNESLVSPFLWKGESDEWEGKQWELVRINSQFAALKSNFQMRIEDLKKPDLPILRLILVAQEHSRKLTLFLLTKDPLGNFIWRWNVGLGTQEEVTF